MKKKIGEIYNKPIVTGDKNLVTKNEIHESTLKGGGTVDSGSCDVEYYSTNLEKLMLLGETASMLMTAFSLFKYTCKPAGDSLEKIINGGWRFYIDSSNSVNTIELSAIAFSKIAFNTVEYNTLKEVMADTEIDISLFDSVFTPITKEEFYDLNNI